MQYYKITYSIQFPIHWYKLDSSKFINEEEAENRFHNGEFYFAVLWNELEEITAIIDYQGNFVGIQIFENGIFEGKSQKVPNTWCVYRAEPEKSYQRLTICQYRYYNRHYNFHDGIAHMMVTSAFLGHDKSYKGYYDQNLAKPLLVAFNDFQRLFDNLNEIENVVNSIEFKERTKRHK